MQIESFETSLVAGRHVVVTINGRMRRIDDWCDDLGISRHTVRSRINRLKWSVREALLTPSDGVPIAKPAEVGEEPLALKAITQSWGAVTVRSHRFIR